MIGDKYEHTNHRRQIIYWPFKIEKKTNIHIEYLYEIYRMNISIIKQVVYKI